MKSIAKRVMLMIMISVLVVTAGTFPTTTTAATKKNPAITAGDYVKMLEKMTKEPLPGSELVTNMEKKITRAQAAVLTNQAAILLDGKDKYNKTKYKAVKDQKRLSNISKCPAESLSSIYKVFVKGIMIGDSNGAYSQSRNFRGMEYFTKDEARTICARLKYPTSRTKISPDGQVIRNTNMPKNAKAYPYILASLPNSFYEMKFLYQYITYHRTPKELVDYAAPSRMKDVNFYSVRYDELKLSWIKKVETNLKHRLNVNYRTIDNNWINGLRETYYIYGNEYDKPQTDAIKQYVANMKKHKVIIKADKIIVEPSTMYYALGLGYCVRVYVKFKVVSATNIPTADSLKQNVIIFSNDGVRINGLKSGKTFAGYFDMALSTRAYNTDGSDASVAQDSIGGKYLR